jgi:hypothetical protein
MGTQSGVRDSFFLVTVFVPGLFVEVNGQKWKKADKKA